MSTLTMTEGETRIVKFTVTFTAGVPAVTAAFADVAYEDLEALAEVTPAVGLAKYDLTAKVYRQGTPGTTIVTKAAADFKECTAKNYTRSEGIVLLLLTAPAQGVSVVELTGTNSTTDIWKDSSTLLYVRRGAA